ncbi:putative RNA-directed DNA polymerase from transposon X-element [Trichonephila clavipes]|nr:putative RNA-directed DNA polymerase from transposon X-element [Trichonephila clavipes]
MNNYKCYRNDRQTAGPASGGTLILIKKSTPHYNTPTLQLFYVEATIVTINPPNLDPLSITSIYVPPFSDKLLFTLDLETIMQVNSHCVIFGDFNATHNNWNCSRNSTRGTQLKDFCDQVNIEIIYPDSPTRYGYNTSNTLDIALLNDFNFPTLHSHQEPYTSVRERRILLDPYPRDVNRNRNRSISFSDSDFLGSARIPPRADDRTRRINRVLHLNASPRITLLFPTASLNKF